MTKPIFKEARWQLWQAITRVYDREHDYSDAELLATFAEQVLNNLTDNTLEPAWLDSKYAATSEAKETAAHYAIDVFTICCRAKRLPHESLELAYWTYHDRYEEKTEKKPKSVATLGPTRLRIERTLKLWEAGRKNIPAPLETLEVDYRNLKRTVIPALNQYGLGINISPDKADWFKKTEIANRRK